MGHSSAASIATGPEGVEASVLVDVVNAFLVLTKKCQHLESAVSVTRRQSDDDVAAARNIVRRWEVYVETLNARIDWLSEEIVIAEAKAAVSETRLAETVALAEAQREAARHAEAVAGRFQERIVALFSDTVGRCAATRPSATLAEAAQMAS